MIFILQYFYICIIYENIVIDHVIYIVILHIIFHTYFHHIFRFSFPGIPYAPLPI